MPSDTLPSMRSSWLTSAVLAVTAIASCSVYGDNLVSTSGPATTSSSTTNPSTASTGGAGGAGGGAATSSTGGSASTTSTTSSGTLSGTGAGTTASSGTTGPTSTTGTGGMTGAGGGGGAGGALASSSSTSASSTTTSSSSSSTTSSTTTSSTTTSSSSTSSTTTSSSGGACTMASQCPGVTTDCAAPACTGGVCGTAFTTAGTATSTQTAGDCQTAVCDGQGNTTSQENDADTPTPTNACTTGACSGGVPVFPPTAAGSTCNQNGGTVCDGAGNCVQCLTNADCASGVCTAMSTCAAPSCTDGLQDGNETDVDCGGTCPVCATGQHCAVPADCAADLCTSGICAGLVLSQVRTRGLGGGNDEIVELYNPTTVPMTFDATWSVAAQAASSATCAGGYATRYTPTSPFKVVGPHQHVLLANSNNVTCRIGDRARRHVHHRHHRRGVSVVLARTIGGSPTAVDALCFYYDTASENAFSITSCQYICEGTPVSNLPHNNTSSGNVDQSLERKGGGALGNLQQTFDNLTDWKTTAPSDPHDLMSLAVP